VLGDRARLKVRVTPGAKEDAIVGWREDVLRVQVRAAPEKGKANEAVCALIASAAGTPKGSVVIERGHASRNKLVLVDGLTEDELMRRLGKPML
jgi:uncharacterized protein (TIGR00251 family)